MDRQEIDRQLQALGKDKKFRAKKEIASLQEILADDEHIFGASSCAMNRDTWVCIITERRIMLLGKGIFGARRFEVYLPHIKSLSCRMGPYFGEIHLDTGDTIHEIQQFPKAETPRLTALVSRLIIQCHAHHAAFPPDGRELVETLERLAALYEKGLLTEDAFEEQKRRLLTAPRVPA